MKVKNRNYQRVICKLIFGFSIFLLLWHIYVFLPVVLSTTEPIGELKIYDRKNVLITHLPKSGGFQIPISDDLTYEAGEDGQVEAKWVEPLPENLVKAFTTIEDERFTSHWGIDALAKLRAFKDNLNAKKIVSGGSTITEQWVKNEYFSHSSRTIPQKLREATVAFYASVLFSKEDILRKYLNTIYFGHRNYGIKAAMKSYFDKSHLETLTEEELITLLAIIRSPGVINLNEQYFQDRWQRIASILNPTLPTDFTLPNNLKSFPGLNHFPHVTSTITQILKAKPSTFNHEPSTIVYSTVDSTLQAEAEKMINQSLTRLAGKNVTNGAAYAVDPRTGEILVWVGSKDFHDKSIDGQVNILTQKRQMGSALKPFIYLYAFIQGAHPDQLIVDLEKDFESAKQDEAYRPLNYGLREGGVMPLKLALANSFNIASVRMLEHLGLENTYRFMKDLGLDFDQPAQHYGLSLALGSPDLKMQEVADAYAALANNGRRIQSHLIKKDEGQMSLRGSEGELEGRSSQSHDFQQERDSRGIATSPTPKNQQFLAMTTFDSAYFYLFETLSNPLNRRRSFGVNSILNTTIPFAVKTGTTKNFHDNWTFGYHPDLVVATWVGNNDNSAMIDVDGITGAGPIWHRLVEFAIQQKYVSPATPYNGVVGTRRGAFLPGKGGGIIQTAKCLNKDCSRTELIYAEPDRVWYSDLESGHYCLEDFYIQTIEPSEISKMAKLFGFKDFRIEWCNAPVGADTAPANRRHRRDVAMLRLYGDDADGGNTAIAGELTILKPTPNETFYIRQDIPLDLQEIILKANQSVDWYLNGSKVGSGENIFIQPIIGKHTISAKDEGRVLEVDILIQAFTP